MGICESTKNKKSEDNIPQTDSLKTVTQKEGDQAIVKPGSNQVQAAKPHASARGPSTTRSTAVIVDSNVLISRSEMNPELIYSKIRKIGEGAFGEVWLVKHKDLQKQFAMKIIKKPANKPLDEKVVMNEINILKKLDHPKIVKILDFYSTETKFFIITEYCSLGELFGEILKVHHFEEGHAAFIMNQIFKVISYCHSMNIIHRDLKPENILIDSKEKNGCPQIKIIDFGTAKIFEKGQNENRFIGSSYYIAPEVIQRSYTEKCDVWSCGIIMYILLTGKPPFNGENDQEILKSIQKGKFDLTCSPFPKISKEAKDLITSLLQLDPNKRITASEALNHKWFTKGTFKNTNVVNEISPDTAKMLLNNIKSYQVGNNILRSTVMAYLVHHNTNIEQCKEAGKLFNSIDLNGDGKIEKHELKEGLLKYWKLPKASIDNEVEQIFNNIDSDQNGYIEYEEFIRSAVDQDYFMTNNYLRFAFRYFDRDNSGDISLDEIFKKFQQSVKNKNDPKVMEELKKTFEAIDINKDGHISYDEFCNMMKNIIKT